MILKEFINVFEDEIAELEKAKNAFDDTITDIIMELNACKGKIVLCGMGKPGHIGRKISATMSSMGIQSYFLHPAEALHGDLGSLSGMDILIAISNSGETAEICRMLPSIKMIGTRIVAVTSYEKSTLAQYADFLIRLPVMKEASNLGLAPTSSSTVELVVGDALSVVLSKMKSFDREDFALYHPAGTIGKKLLTRVSDLMHSGEDNPVILAGSSFQDAIIKMSRTGLGGISIVDGGQNLSGLIVDGDIKRYLERKVDIYNIKVDDVMNADPVTVRQDVLAAEALKIMENRDNVISVMPVLDEKDKVCGFIRNHDIIKAGIL